ncbi:McrB family protein [Pontibacter ruber]|uniref:McrB family protein n=1 Tax=Pontibacter ruber TaxID=1343895 RepID=A0ABW5D117_9BACT|nr:AAA family ATPase [Pontibacter ruber]
MSLTTLIDKSPTYNLSADWIKVNEDNRQAFVQRFPLDKLNNLSLEEYALGTNRNSLCYWLEYKDTLFGIGGGNSSKFGIYKAHEDGQYYKGKGKNKVALSDQAAEDFFRSIRDSVIQALEYVQQDSVEKIRGLQIPLWSMVLQNVLSMYFPEKFLTVGAPDVILECARDIQIEETDLTADNSILINYLCKQKLDKQDAFKDWSYLKLGQFIWSVYHEDSKRDYYIIGSKYGDNARIDIFPQMLQRSVVATGFASHIDLTDYYRQNHSTIRDFLKQQGEENRSHNALKYFLNLKPGDRIAIKADGSPKGSQGFLSIIGLAEVCERNGKTYEYDPDELGHIVHVKFLKAPVYKEFPQGGFGSTLHKLSDPKHIKMIFKSPYEDNERVKRFKAWLEGVYKQSNGPALSERSVSSYLNGIKFIEREIIDKALYSTPLFAINEVGVLQGLKSKYFAVPDIKERDEKGNQMYSNAFKRYIEFMEYEVASSPKLSDSNQNEFKMPLNTILYGPPGTGKTYRLKNEYVDRFTDKQAVQTLDELCEGLVKDLAWWEVICIVVLDLGRGTVAQIYKHPLLQAKLRLSQNKTPKNTIWMWLQRHTKADCPHVNIQKRSLPQLFWKDEEGSWTADEAVAKVETPDFYDILLQYRSYEPNAKEEKRYVFTTFHQSFAYEDFIEGIKPRLTEGEETDELQDISYQISNGIFKEIAEKAKSKPDKKFAIFIDEINRGNIANIFGELITLIEEDKRIGRQNYLPAVLPYSKKEFGVPDNLYIIGTMNTADRSVEALDTALRRRFSFVEMNPEPKILSEPQFKCNGIELDRLLEAINDRVELLLDKDYCIGHSYFMTIQDRENPVSELTSIFSNKVLPLLQEYFYGDWGKIQLILGKGFVAKKVSKVAFLASDDTDEYQDYEDKPIYYFTEAKQWTLDTFRTIYE